MSMPHWGGILTPRQLDAFGSHTSPPSSSRVQASLAVSVPRSCASEVACQRACTVRRVWSGRRADSVEPKRLHVGDRPPADCAVWEELELEAASLRGCLAPTSKSARTSTFWRPLPFPVMDTIALVEPDRCRMVPVRTSLNVRALNGRLWGASGPLIRASTAAAPRVPAAAVLRPEACDTRTVLGDPPCREREHRSRCDCVQRDHRRCVSVGAAAHAVQGGRCPHREVGVVRAPPDDVAEPAAVVIGHRQ